MQTEKGFTLVEVMMVVIILAILSAIALPRIAASSDIARTKADIATAHQIKIALDRYQAEHGVYPKKGEITASEGVITAEGFIPDYISKLDKSTTQQNSLEENKGFGIDDFSSDGTFATPAHLIMIYLTVDGSAAEVRAFNSDLSKVLWSSL